MYYLLHLLKNLAIFTFNLRNELHDSMCQEKFVEYEFFSVTSSHTIRR